MEPTSYVSSDMKLMFYVFAMQNHNIYLITCCETGRTSVSQINNPCISVLSPDWNILVSHYRFYLLDQEAWAYNQFVWETLHLLCVVLYNLQKHFPLC